MNESGKQKKTVFALVAVVSVGLAILAACWVLLSLWREPDGLKADKSEEAEDRPPEYGPIPTSSMEPTLRGGERGADWVYYEELAPRDSPRRWDIVLFRIDGRRIDHYRARRSPADVRQLADGMIEHGGAPHCVEYVKRVVAVPGETVQIKNGDLFVKGKIRRKPERVREALLIPVTNDELLKKRGRKFLDAWRRSDERSIRAAGDETEFSASGAAGPRQVLYVDAIQDRYESDVNSTLARQSAGALNVVGDLKLAFRFRHLSGAGDVLARLSEDGVHHWVHVPVGNRPGVATVRWGRSEAEAATVAAAEPLALKGEHVLEFSNVDARVVVRIDGREVIAFDKSRESDAHNLPEIREHRSGVALGAEDCDVAVWDVRLWRDIYYTSSRSPRTSFGVRQPFRLGTDDFFVLGDNSPNSFDSRHWGVVKRRNLFGKVISISSPPERRGPVY